MERRNKRNIAIGILCTLLVFMGVGYAALNQVLDINGTARSTNTWSIVIKSITYKEEASGGAIDKGASVGTDRISANFESEFTKPGDYITYEIVVKNEGTLPAKIDRINTILPNAETATQQELSDLSLFGLEYDESIIGKALSAGSSETFTVTVRYRSGATRLPSGDVHAGIEIVAVQDTTGGSGNITPEPSGDDWLYQIYSDEQDKKNYGLITDFNYDSPQAQKDENGNYTIVVPAEIGGIPITSIDASSFARKNLLMSGDYTKIVITDKAKADEIEEIANIVFPLLMGSMPTIEEDSINTTGFAPVYFDIQKYNEYKENDVAIDGSNVLQIMNYATSNSIKVLDLSEATNLKTIGSDAFTGANLTAVNLGNTITTIGDNAFAGNKISSLIIPNSVITIGGLAFNSNQISGELIIPDSVTTIGYNAFSANEINSLTIGRGVTSIASFAFANQRDTVNNATLTSITIKRPDRNAFLANVTGANGSWYDNTLNPTITYDPS